MALLEENESQSQWRDKWRILSQTIQAGMIQKLRSAVVITVVAGLLVFCFWVIGGGAGPQRNEKLLPREQCGVGTNNTEGNLVGFQAGLDDAPWLALLRLRLIDGRAIYSCTGSLINERYVLTAAHCLAGGNIPPDAFIDQVRLGEYNLDTSVDCIGDHCSPPPEDIEVEERIIHPHYDPLKPEPHNDIALIRLRRNVKMSDYVKPICLSSSTNYEEGKSFLFAGWSRIHTTGKPQKPEKMKIMLPVINFQQCNTHYQSQEMGFHLNESSQVCIGGFEGRNEYCHWGTGGPSMSLEPVGSEMRWHVVGIASYGPPNCGEIQENQPDIHTKVAEYLDWILENLRE